MNDRFTLLLGPFPSFTSVMRLRLRPDDVEDTVGEVRHLIEVHRHTQPTWWIGSSAMPKGLTARLLGLGFAPRDQAGWEPRCTSMALVDEPPVAEGAQGRRVENFEEYLLSLEVGWDAFGSPEEDREERRAVAKQEWESRGEQIMSYLAFVDGRPVASALAVAGDAGLLMIGGGTLPDARGRGAYRALVRARWDDAVDRGTPALVTQAGAMSRPILERLGFVAVAEVDVLLDAGFST